MELEKERKNATVDVTSLARLYLDVRRLEGYTMQELKAFEDDIKKQDFLFNMEDYYLEGEDRLQNNMKKALSLENYAQSKGLGQFDPIRVLVNPTRF